MSKVQLQQRRAKVLPVVGPFAVRGARQITRLVKTRCFRCAELKGNYRDDLRRIDYRNRRYKSVNPLIGNDHESRYLRSTQENPVAGRQPILREGGKRVAPCHLPPDLFYTNFGDVQLSL